MKIIEFPGNTSLPERPERTLERALKKKWDCLLVIGWLEDGGFDADSSHPSGEKALMLLEIMKQELMHEICGGQ